MTALKEHPFEKPTVCKCGMPIVEHLKCDGCTAMFEMANSEPGIHCFQPIRYRRKLLCRGCIQRWQVAEQAVGREMKYTEVFKKGLLVCPKCGSDEISMNQCQDCGAVIPPPPPPKRGGRGKGKKKNGTDKGR
jgi:hypothetical protein